MKLFYCVTLFAISAVAQVVPPAPTLTPLPIQAPAVANVKVEFDAPQCGQTPPSGCQGLTDCSCWVQIWKAQCSSATTCPAPVKTGPYTMSQTVTVGTWVDNGRGGQHIVMTDTDTVLTAGTIWQWFATTNFGAAVSPPAYSPPSNGSGAVTIPGSTPPPAVNFKVQLDYDNSQCVTGNNCNAAVYRAVCPNASSCPVYSPTSTSFTKLTTTDTQTVSATNTHFISLDTGVSPNPLAYNTMYIYAVTNSFQANPSQPSAASSVTVTTPTGIHQAILNWSNPNCRTTSPCTLQVYRAQCTSTTSCPTYVAGNSAWKALDMSKGLVPTVGTQSTSWQYTDNDSTLVGNTTYTWVATNSYTGATTSSPASSAFNGTTAVGKSVRAKVIKIDMTHKEEKK